MITVRLQQSARRLTGIVTAILLHAIAIYALTSGLGHRLVEVMRPPIEARIIVDEPPTPVPPVTPPPRQPPPPPRKRPPPPYRPPVEVAVTQPVAVPNAITTEVSEPPPPAPIPQAVRKTPVLDASRSCPQPQYPSASRRNAETGVVVLRFLIEVDGRAIDSAVETSSGHPRLDEAARWALGLCRFRPGTVDGVPERSWARIKYVWTLQ